MAYTYEFSTLNSYGFELVVNKDLSPVQSVYRGLGEYSIRGRENEDGDIIVSILSKKLVYGINIRNTLLSAIEVDGTVYTDLGDFIEALDPIINIPVGGLPPLWVSSVVQYLVAQGVYNSIEKVYEWVDRKGTRSGIIHGGWCYLGDGTAELQFGAGFESKSLTYYDGSSDQVDTTDVSGNWIVPNTVQASNIRIEGYVFWCQETKNNGLSSTSYSTTSGVTATIANATLASFHLKDIDHPSFVDTVGYATKSGVDGLIPLDSNNESVVVSPDETNVGRVKLNCKRVQNWGLQGTSGTTRAVNTGTTMTGGSSYVFNYKFKTPASLATAQWLFGAFDTALGGISIYTTAAGIVRIQSSSKGSGDTNVQTIITLSVSTWYDGTFTYDGATGDWGVSFNELTDSGVAELEVWAGESDKTLACMNQYVSKNNSSGSLFDYWNVVKDGTKIIEYWFSEGAGSDTTYNRANEGVNDGALDNFTIATDWAKDDKTSSFNLDYGFSDKLRCRTAGTAYKVNTNAYGLVFDGVINSTSGAAFTFQFNSDGTTTINNGYFGIVSGAMALKFWRRVGAGLVAMFSTVDAYITADMDYRILVFRNSVLDEYVTGAIGTFAFYIQGKTKSITDTHYTAPDLTAMELVVASTGTNPITDNTYTTSAYYLANVGVADVLKRLRIGSGYFSLNDFTNGTGVYDQILIPSQIATPSKDVLGYKLTNPKISVDDFHNGSETEALQYSSPEMFVADEDNNWYDVSGNPVSNNYAAIKAMTVNPTYSDITDSIDIKKQTQYDAALTGDAKTSADNYFGK
jgi:hypothetical protein